MQRPVILVWTKGGTEVLLSSSLDGWREIYPLFHHEIGGYHWMVINFVEGTHYYRFCVDGMWTVAEEHPIQLDDKGIRSNVLQVR